MLPAFIRFLTQSAALVGSAIGHLTVDGWRFVPKRALVVALGAPLLIGLAGLHWLGFVLDELLFPGYRRIRVERPVFIVGIPRSGTTFLHRLLARDPSFATMRAWECVLAPSISERYLVRAVGRALAPLAGRWPRNPLSRFDAIHPVRLTAPEEDFLVLLAAGACLLPAIGLPRAGWLWALAFFDRDLPERERRIVADFYFRCVQRHLYFHGAGARYLAKNPSFTPMLETLATRFPDATFIACTREPVSAVASQLSALRPALRLAGRGHVSPELRDRVLAMLRFYYRHLGHQLDEDVAGRRPSSTIVGIDALRKDLPATLARIYAHLGATPPPEMRPRATPSERGSRGHRYSLEEFGLQETQIRKQFSDVWPLPARTSEAPREVRR